LSWLKQTLQAAVLLARLLLVVHLPLVALLDLPQQATTNSLI
jgi:hypothetical protein